MILLKYYLMILFLKEKGEIMMFEKKFDELNNLLKRKNFEITNDLVNDINYISYRYKKTMEDNKYLSDTDIKKVIARLELQVDDLLFKIAS